MILTNLITIDGPSASGKSSVSRLVAKKLGWKWVSTGAFYRGLALAAMKEQTDKGSHQDLVALSESDVWKVVMTPQDTEVYYRDQPVTEEISGEKVGALASEISQIPQVREALLARQRNCYNQELGLVAEGRDCGTVVFPQAESKIYLTANPNLRALRRSKEEGASAMETEKLQEIRDLQDSTRKVAPLKEADGALKIDSSFLSLEEVVQEVVAYHQRTSQ